MIGLFLPERRSDSVGYGPLDDFWYGPVGRTVSSRVNVNENTALNYSACWAATRVLAGTAGWLPLNLYKYTYSQDRAKPGVLDRNDGRRIESIVQDDRRNTCVSKSPNPQMIPMLFKSQGFNQQINGGNAYAEIQWDTRGNLAALWPIHHTRVDPLINQDDGELWYKVRNNNAEPTYLQSKEVLHFPSMMSDDGIVGKGVVRHAREAIGMGLATERYGASWFGKGGVPRVVITHPNKMSDTARTNFRSEWKDIYGGPDGEKVALLQEGATASPLNINNEDSQFLETRQFNIEEIARWYGVPPHMLQHLLRATFNNIEQLGIDFVTYSLMQWLTIWEQELSKKLLTEEEQKTMCFLFDDHALMRGDSASRAAFWNTLISTGIACRNEARMAEGLNPVEGGDTFLAQGAMFALDENGVPIPPGGTAQPETLDDADEDEEAAGETEDDNQEPSESDSPAENDGVDPENNSTTGSIAKVFDAVKLILEGTLNRMIRKEATAARRASSKPGEFLKWMDEFYVKHTEQLAESLQCPFEAANCLGYSLNADLTAVSQVDASKEALLELTDKNTSETFANAVDVLMCDWETRRAASCAEAVFRKDSAV